MAWNVRFVSTYPPRRCGIGTFCRDLSNALSRFTSEIANIRVAAIDNGNGPYNIPVDIVINQYKEKSWIKAAERIIYLGEDSFEPTVVILQHEFGLDSSEERLALTFNNFVKMASELSKRGFIIVVYLHTVLENPTENQQQVIKQLADFADGLVVTTESAIDILNSPVYNINQQKLKHIDHGIRMLRPTHYDRFTIKTGWGLQDYFLVTTIGMLSPGKGIEYGIKAYGRFVLESCTPAQRENIVYLIAGQCHPEFIKHEGGKRYRSYRQTLFDALKESGMQWAQVTDLRNVDWSGNDIIFFDTFIDENTLLKLYGASNVMVLPYLNMEQISSGILADTIGSGRVAIATKFRYAMELIYSNKTCPEGLIIGRYARGILVDPGEKSIDQIAQALDFMVFEKEKRLRMEKQAYQRGYQMRWSNSAWALIQYLNFLHEEKGIRTGRGVRFSREKESRFQCSDFPVIGVF